MSTSLHIRDIFEQWLVLKQYKTCSVVNKIKEFVENHLERVLIDSEEQKINFMILKINNYWNKHSRTRIRFEAELSCWLDTEIFNEEVCDVSYFSHCEEFN